jgi:hypothetical protein
LRTSLSNRCARATSTSSTRNSPAPGGRPGAPDLFSRRREDLFRLPSRDPADDVVLPLDHPAWVNIDDKMSLYFRGSGATRYTNRHFLKVWHAVADDLELSVLEAPQAFPKDSLVAELITLICPGQKHEEIEDRTLVVAETGEGARAALAGRYLAWVNFGDRPFQGEAFFAGSPGDDVPVYPGVTTLGGDGWRYKLEGGALEAAALEPRGSLRISAGRPESQLRVEAVPSGAVYDQPARAVSMEWGPGPERADPEGPRTRLPD